MITLDSLIKVSYTLAKSASPVQNTTNLLVLTGSTVINLNERYRSYTSASAVAEDFGEDGDEYASAVLWFGQTPPPSTLLIGRWANVPAAGQLIGATLSAAASQLSDFTGIADGGFEVTLDGVAHQVSGLNFTQAVTLNGIAEIIQTGIANGAQVIWNNDYSRFEFTSGTTGATSTVAYLGTPSGNGVSDISGLLGGTAALGATSVPGQAAETAIAAATLFDAAYGGQWYALVIPGAADADHIQVGPFIEATTRKHVYGVTTADPDTLNNSSSTDVLSKLKALGLTKTIVQYSSSSDVAIVSALALLLGVDYTASNSVITLMWKTQPGVTPENLTDSQQAALLAKNGNFYGLADNGDGIFEPGTTVSTSIFADTIVGADNLTVAITQAIYSKLRSNGRIGQTDAGMQELVSAVQGIADQYVTNGFLAAGTWNGPLFGSLTSGEFLSSGYYIYAAPVATQAEAQRQQRIAVPIQVAGKLAGAVHTASVAITLNP